MFHHEGLCLALQDSIDLFLGNFALDETNGPTPLRVQKDWKFLTVSAVWKAAAAPPASLRHHWICLTPLCVSPQLPIIMLVAFSMCIVCLLMAGKVLRTRGEFFSSAAEK